MCNMCNTCSNAATFLLLLICLSFPCVARGRSGVVGVVEPIDGSGGHLQNLICLSLDFLEEEEKLQAAAGGVLAV